ncbi:DEAD/DEAH box helicase [Actinomadura latina]|uniref:DEAD/DEAH box helicase family protein n=1 Tax=Actinomadura latina TaxID=163603 RepID=A0A846YZ98_9ACTN|nr:helicase-related protein [Actinomadura latina]NKZ06300.1 DEAD/DEAH box helicase family protein [Actinomadura latina]
MSDHDLRYEPPGKGWGWLTTLAPASCLVIGNTPDGERDAICAVAADVREIPASPLAQAVMRRGGYAFRKNEKWYALVVWAGLNPGPPDTGNKRSNHNDHLEMAMLAYETHWKEGTQFAGDSLFRVGDMVQTVDTGTIGRIRNISSGTAGYSYNVDVGGALKRFTQQALTRIEGDPKDPSFWLSAPPADATATSLTLTWTKLRHHLTDTLYSFASSKTLFRAYQFTPVLKLLNGSSGRLLIADEVGLGKTIEAGLIWSELEQRLHLDRVLVVAPSALTRKWKAEMSRRFDRELDILKPADLEKFAAGLADRTEPELRGIISLESLRVADRVLTELTELHPRFDLVIVDEAHYLRNRESKSHALGRLLADWSDYLLLLSATPLNLGNDDLFNLMSLLDEENFGDRAVFEQQLEPNQVLNKVARSLLDQGLRREPRKLDAELARLEDTRFGAAITAQAGFTALRQLLATDRPLGPRDIAHARRLLGDLNVLSSVLTRTRKVEVTTDYKAVREARTINVDWTPEEKAYYDGVYNWCMRRAREMGTPPGFAMQMPLRLAASCIPASQEMLRSKDPVLFQQSLDDFDDERQTSLSGVDVPPVVAVRPSTDTKYERLLDTLREVRQAGIRQAMVFSFFRGTLRYLGDRLGEHFSVRVMDGGVKPENRQEIMDDFRAGKFELLLLSEVGSEGLDFEFCNVLVNYDLPWNPMRVEQRIGRLDRFGQQNEKIFVYNMHVPGTIEADIFERLYARIGVFEGSIGELEPILRSEVENIPRRVLDPKLDAKSRQAEIDRIAAAIEQRRHDTEGLDRSRAFLSGLDNLLVEGLTEKGLGSGRFIGQGEIRQIVAEMLRLLGGRIGRPDRDGVFTLVGSAPLAERLRSSRAGDDGSRYPRARLAALLQNEDRIRCTFRPEVASVSNVELLSARHPLVKLALEVLEAEGLALQRFGSVTVPGLPENGRYLVRLDLAETSGLRPLVELWATAIDLDTGETDEDAGRLLLTALAEGTLGDGPSATPPGAQRALALADEHAAERQQQTEETRKRENAALVESRILARESSLDIQIRKTEELIARLRGEHKSDSIIRLHAGRIRNLRAHRVQVRQDLTRRKELTVSTTPVALVLTAGAEGRIPSRNRPPEGRSLPGGTAP